MQKTYEPAAITKARTEGSAAQNFEEEARQYVGSNWNRLTRQEQESIISDIEKNWYRNTSF